VVALCAKIEAELADLDDADKQDFLADLGLEEPGLNRLIRAGYQLLGLQTYFTAGVKEVRAWTIHVGDTAPQAAGVIHTDFERGFIRAQTIALADFIAYKRRTGRQGSLARCAPKARTPCNIMWSRTAMYAFDATSCSTSNYRQNPVQLRQGDRRRHQQPPPDRRTAVFEGDLDLVDFRMRTGGRCHGAFSFEWPSMTRQGSRRCVVWLKGRGIPD
jgi:hypothetical protein